jgi:hypothetical protein
MSKLRCHISISLDGFVAGPNQSEENPLGEGGERLHDWVVPLAAWRQSHGKQGGEVNESTQVFEESVENLGAGVMGRNMFGPIGGGDWGDEQWTGSSTWRRDCWTNLSSTSFRCCSATVLASSTTSGTRRCSSSRSEPSRRPASPTSSTGV